MALHHATPGEVVDLSLKALTNEADHSTAIVKTDQFEAIRLVIPRGADMPQHQVRGPITLHCLQGRIEIGMEDRTIELASHQWVFLEAGAAHSVRGIEDSVLLLTILFADPEARSVHSSAMEGERS